MNQKQKVKKQANPPVLQKQAKNQKTQQPSAKYTPLQNSLSPISSLSPTDIAQLQRTIGNQALAGLQTKLTVGPAGDQYEQEADNVAAQVVNKINAPSTQTIQSKEEEEVVQAKPLSSEISSIQRQENEEEQVQAKSIQRQEKEEEEEVQTKSIQRQENEEEKVQAKSASIEGGPVSKTVENDIQNAKGSGQPLADGVRTNMENAFSADFSRIKIHTDNKADSLNRSVQARAFTTGQDIFFRQGEYNPGSKQGQELLAHELTHTIQQGAAPQTSQQVQRHTSPNLQREAAATENVTTDEKDRDKPALLKIHSDIEAESMGISELKQGAVGHSWVSLHWKDPKAVPDNIEGKHKPFLQKGEDPFGFWPRMFQDYDPILNEWQSADDRVGYSTNPFASYVPGQMLHPDIMHQPRATQIYDITRDQADQVINYAESKRGAQYSVFFYNCTTFAKEAVEAAGISPPDSSTLGICYPNALYDAIKKNQKKGIGTTELTDSGGNTTRIEGEEETKKN